VGRCQLPNRTEPTRLEDHLTSGVEKDHAIPVITGLQDVVLAQRAGVDAAFVDRLVDLGVISPTGSDEYSASDVRRVRIVQSLEQAGLPLETLGTAFRAGILSLDFVDQKDYKRFASLSDVTFRAASERSGVPVELLLVIREATSSMPASPDDFMREDELKVVPLVELQMRENVRPAVIERALRGYGDSIRRVAEIEASWWRTDILDPLGAAGMDPMEVGERIGRFGPDLARFTDQAVLALFHAHEANAWMRNIFEGFENTLVEAGLHTKPETVPAICFLDLTGYTRLTDERGDEAAAEVAAELARHVQRTAAQHHGKSIKWLGDGVMFYFKQPGSAVVAALEMVERARTDGLPPAHVGLHCGPVLYQGGDYFGRTVNVASRIADYARQGEVLVSHEVVEAAADVPVRFSEIGPVELRGLTNPLRLHVAHRAAV
jgi:adenylate cyclase